jgi:predicted RNA-binding Zn ribbon-like protein
MADTHFREGAGRLCLDFLRTYRRRGLPGESEELTGPAELAGWIAQLGPAGLNPAQPGIADIRAARAVREAVLGLITAARAGQPCPAGARGRVNRAAAAPTPAPSLDRAGGELRWHADDPTGATLALIARDTLDLVTSPALHRVRDCANPECSAMFLDSSRPGSRRWCSMGLCGNQAKKAALRAR